MSRGVYIPLPEVAEHIGDQLGWSVGLPDYAPIEGIGVNLEKLSKLAHLGGFGHLHVTGYAGELTKETPVMTSVDERGQATAGLGGAVVRAEVLKASVSPDLTPGSWDELLHAYQWPNGKLSININEIDSLVGKAGDLHDPKAWAEKLNKFVALGTRQITRKHLFTERSAKEKYAVVAPWIMPSFSVMQAIANDSPTYLPFAVLYLAGGTAFIHGARNMHARRHGLSRKDLRSSVFPGIQLDRILAVEALSRTSPLVKDLSSKLD